MKSLLAILIYSSLSVPYAQIAECSVSLQRPTRQISCQLNGSKVTATVISGRELRETKLEGTLRCLIEIQADGDLPLSVSVTDVPKYMSCVSCPVGTDRRRWICEAIFPAGLPKFMVNDVIPIGITMESKAARKIEESILYISVKGMMDKGVEILLSVNGFPRMSDAEVLPKAESIVGNRIGVSQPKLSVKDRIPDLILLDCFGRPWNLRALRGTSRVLITFFPLCFTGGCATHLSSLRDMQAEFDKSRVQILAISVDEADGEKGQKEFASQWGFNFPLIPDPKRDLSLLFGAVQSKSQLASRMSLYIDSDGYIQWIGTDIQESGYASSVLSAIGRLDTASNKQ